MTKRVLLAAPVLFACFAAASAYAVDRGQAAPELGVTDTSGRVLRIGSLRGSVVLVDFWASWCEHCVREMAVLEGLYAGHHAEGFVVVGLSQDEDEGHMRDFLGHVAVSFPVARDRGHAAAGRYGPTRMPSTYVIDRRGIVRYVHAGFQGGDAPRLETEVSALLAEPR